MTSIVAIYKGLVSRTVQAHRQEDWTVDHVAAAVALVKFSLGHASEDLTRLYARKNRQPTDSSTFPTTISLEATRACLRTHAVSQRMIDARTMPPR